MRIEIEVHTQDRDLLLWPGEKLVRLGEQLEVRYEGIVLQESEVPLDALMLLVQVPSVVAVADAARIAVTFASWFCDTFMGKADKVVIERTMVEEITEGKISRVFQETITKG